MIYITKNIIHEFSDIITSRTHFFIYFNEIFEKEGVFTFPVLTLAISLDENKEYMDYDFVKWCFYIL